jgi:hypothetical protein
MKFKYVRYYLLSNSYIIIHSISFFYPPIDLIMCLILFQSIKGLVHYSIYSILSIYLCPAIYLSVYLPVHLSIPSIHSIYPFHLSIPSIHSIYPFHLIYLAILLLSNINIFIYNILFII